MHLTYESSVLSKCGALARMATQPSEMQSALPRSNALPPESSIRARELTLLDTIIIILTSCSLVIFVFTIGAKFLHQDTFDKLPDFIKNSYSALWSAGVVAGGALVGSVIDALAKRESSKQSFILYIMVTTLLIMTLIVGTIELARSIDEPRFAAPSGAATIAIAGNTSRPISFYLNHSNNFGYPARIQGRYETKDGELSGEVLNSELEPVTPSIVAPTLQITSISIHVCYFGVQNHLPIFSQEPQFPTASNSQTISTMANMQQPFSIPNFKFKIDVTHVNSLAPPYLCAFVDGQQNFHVTYY
jgi:hypothetical protein